MKIKLEFILTPEEFYKLNSEKSDLLSQNEIENLKDVCSEFIENGQDFKITQTLQIETPEVLKRQVPYYYYNSN